MIMVLNVGNGMEIEKTMKRVFVFTLTLFTFVALSGCGFFDAETGIEKDRKEQREILNGLFVTYWKGAKISIRSLPVDVDTETIDFSLIKQQQAQSLGLGKHLGRIYDWESILKDIDEDPDPLTAKEFIAFAQEVYVMAQTIDSLDEDAYPTFAHIMQQSDRVLHGRTIELPKYWNNSMDHWVFALVMESRFGFGSWKSYELDKVHPKDLVTSDYRVVANLHKGIDHLRNQWYYLADESFSRAIAEFDSNQITLQPHTTDLISQLKNKDLSTEEQFKHITRACSYLFRGFSRYQADHDDLNKKATEDIEAAIADFHRLGIENELVWLAESYVFIHQNKKEKAFASLTKLEASALLSDKERKLISQAKHQIDQRDSDSALNFLTDKLLVSKLGYSYAMSYATEIQWMQLLEKTEQGRRILKRFTELKQTYEKAKDYLDLDRLKEKGKTLFKQLTE